ncbi:methylated-DNA--[protein]-cysteine S-methyltransferase [Congregibacter brevis]|uniref:Methylated-DNA--[protein]-cysteine S-methyltransferase n=1 Tax=Congregibacter brevis TaxID=3081201 RepID=A0ABZ0IG89_9GAMM|nr:methylated-DNA--[protein]-cysteine S-methyltransferase [Congregibacter sp. IMCC45268]
MLYTSAPASETNHAMPASKHRPAEHAHYRMVADAISYLREHQREQPDLATLARAVGTSESHLQRVFSSWAGVSPKRFLQIITRQYALDALRNQASVLDATLHAGLSGPGRLHDLTLACDAMTPGEIASCGKGIDLEYGWGDTPFGPAFVAWSQRGICQLSFCDSKDAETVRAFRRDWRGATHLENSAAAAKLLQRVFAAPLEQGKLHLLLRGTNFQVKVWEALMQVNPGDLVSYQQLGAIAGTGNAHRAVGSAMARNRIAYLIPCHRVIRQGGDWGNYRWGLERKLALHVWEQIA